MIKLETLVKLSKEVADTSGTSLQGHLYNTTYSNLYDTFGEPTYFPDDCGDGKVNFEWVFEFNGEIFTIYDWKTYDEEYTMYELTKWNISGASYYGDFSNYIESLLKIK